MTADQERQFRHSPAQAVVPALGPPTRRRLLRWLLAISVVVLSALAVYLAGFAFFASHIAGLKTPANAPRADAIVVLTGGQARLQAAVELLRSGSGQRLLISGVHPSAKSGALQRATGADASLFACCIDIDRAALDTIGNAVESAKWMASGGYNRVVVVTNNYHMPRSMLEMQRQAAGAELIPYPVVNSDLANGSWLTEPAALRVLFTEYGKYVMTLVRGAG